MSEAEHLDTVLALMTKKTAAAQAGDRSKLLQLSEPLMSELGESLIVVTVDNS